MNYDNFLNDLKMEESQEMIKKIAAERIEKEKKRTEKKERIMSGIEYIEWLKRFTKDNDGFTDDDWTYSYEKLNESDQEKVNDLILFYEGIFKYAMDNYIYSTKTDFGEYYKLRIGDIGFRIGYITGQGTMFYCKKVKMEDEPDFIDFMDIITNKEQENTSYIKKNLDYLSNVIRNVYSSGEIPIDAIIDEIEKTISSITRKEKNKEKVFAKKKC